MPSITQADPTTVLESGIRLLTQARWYTDKIIATLSESQCVHQPCRNANHALWMLGHIADTDDYFIGATGGRKKLDESWSAKFGMKSRASADPKSYPTKAELLETAHERREAFVSHFRSLPPERLTEETPEELRMFAPTVGEILHSIAWHEGVHAGQISVARKSLGMPPILG